VSRQKQGDTRKFAFMKAHRASLMVVIAIGSLSCGGSGFDSFVDQYAQAVCHRTFQCCSAADRKTSASEAACAQAMAASLRQSGEQAIGTGLVRFDAAAGNRCLAHLQTDACPAIFGRAVGQLIGCENFLPGAGALGALCDDDFVCESTDCEGQHCVVRPCACGMNQFCDPSANQCVSAKGAGETCQPGQCDSTLACIGSQCAAPLADGQPCSDPSVCAGTCTVNQPGQGSGACRPGICQGP